MVGSFENLIMCPPTPCHFFNGKPCSYILNLVLTIKFSFLNVPDEILWHGIRFYLIFSMFEKHFAHIKFVFNIRYQKQYRKIYFHNAYGK